MKKIYLQKIEQHGIVCFIGKIDPRDLVRVATKVQMSVVQDAQRPLNERRVKDIAKYVNSSHGILPSTLTLATKDNKFSVLNCEGVDNLFYILFPETESEYANYTESIDVMDGQHRLYSFSELIRSIPDSEKFEIGFTLYIRPTLLERQQIFISCNEKQEKVSGNLLMWFKEKLNLLTNDEKRFFPVVSKLNNEYPLKGHIIMSAEKVKNGVKANYIIEALKQAGVQNMLNRGEALSDDILVKVISMYLSAWERVVQFSFVESNAKQAGPAIKGAGLKYMLLLLPTFWNRAITLQKKFDSEYIENTIRDFITCCGVVQSEFFTCEQHIMWFRDRTSIDKFAKDSAAKINGLSSQDFDPLASL